jgi:hypothetical protein
MAAEKREFSDIRLIGGPHIYYGEEGDIIEALR